jgi:transcriptional regulator with XRE-family HTH domain
VIADNEFMNGTTEIGHRLRLARMRKGLGVTQVARLLGLSPPSISNWEGGQTKSPRLRNLTRAAAIYECHAWGIIEGSPIFSQDEMDIVT